MICYFPFTYLPDNLIAPLAGTLGPMTVLQPTEKQVSARVQKGLDDGDLQLSIPSGIDAEHLEQAVQRFTSWAALHGGKPGDLKGFFQSSQGAAEWFQGPPTNRIRAELRNEAQRASSAPHVDVLFQDGFFLALAHLYDQQQDALARDLGSVRSLEARFGEILGEPGDRKTALGPDLSTVSAAGPSDQGLFMTTRRLEAWARLASACGISADLFVTTSKAVWDQLFDDLPEMGSPQTVSFGLGHKAHDERAVTWAATLAAMARADEPGSVSLPDPETERDAGRGGASLTLCTLAGMPPRDMLARLIHEEPPAGGAVDTGGIRNTLIGYIAIAPVGD